MYRRDLVWHLREHHRKEHGFTDAQLTKEFVHMPKDLRKIICAKCSETEAHENAVWLAVDPNEITKDLKIHANERHGVTGKEVDSCFRLMCMGCNDKFELDGEIKEWDEHMERQPCRNRPAGAARDSRSRSRSRSPYEPDYNRGENRGGGNAPPKRDSSPVPIDLDRQCNFCNKEVESKALMEAHVRQRHLEMAFICRPCETGNIHYEPDLPSIKDHLREDHGKDDLDNEDVKDYTRYPRSLMCIKCNLCGLLCHGQKEEDLELHFKVFHEEAHFSTQHLDFLCRICMISGQNDSLNELKDHLYNSHPDEVK
jgi:predicted small metal-binding protein